MKKKCLYCKHCIEYGLHAVKIKCNIDNEELFPYITEDYNKMINKSINCKKYEER